MKVSFPFMGPTFVYRSVLERLGHEVIFPNRPTKKTIELGTLNAPEFACFPLKVLMGSYLESIERGAQVIVTSGGVGPCRAGWYGHLHNRILADLGKDVEFIIFEPSWAQVKKQAEYLRGRNPWWHLVSAMRDGIRLLRLYEELEHDMQEIRVREINRGQTTEAWNKIIELFTRDSLSYIKLKTKSKELLASIPVDKDIIPLKVGMIGEIYVLMEPSVNMGMEERLNNLGCVVERSIYLYEWLCETALPLWLQPQNNRDIIAKSKRHIPLCIGGHARQSVGAAQNFADRGFNGVVHLMPFACTPEIVTSSILPNIARQTGMPAITFSIDEQTAEANVQTRLEAFVDLMLGNLQEGYRRESIYRN